MKCLAFDIGLRRTGVAFFDSSLNIPLPLDSLISQNEEELIEMIYNICTERKVDCILFGLPLLPTGEEGSQVEFVRNIGQEIEKRLKIKIEYLDERFTTWKEKGSDHRSALAILEVWLNRIKK